MGRLTRHVLDTASGRPAARRSDIEFDGPAFGDVIPIPQRAVLIVEQEQIAGG